MAKFDFSFGNFKISMEDISEKMVSFVVVLIFLGFVIYLIEQEKTLSNFLQDLIY